MTRTRHHRTRLRRRPPRPTGRRVATAIAGMLPGILLACAPVDRAPEDGSADAAVPGATRAFVGATIIDGTGRAPIADGVLLVTDGRITDVGADTEVTIPPDADRIDVTGRYLIPGLINTHGHVGETVGLETGHYSRANVLRQLALYARYGVTTVVSLGGDGPEAIAVRDEEDATRLDRARLLVAGTVVTGDTPAAAVEMVDANAALGVDVIKIRVDDNLRTTEKMSPDVYGAVIERAHRLGLPLAAHLFYLDDAKRLVRAGADFVAHSVRDRPVDGELIGLLRDGAVCYTPTLTRELSTFVYESEPAFFADPFFLRDADPVVLAALRDPERQAAVRADPAARRYREALAVAQANLRTLSGAGVTIALGTDTGPPGRFQGYFEHLEADLMAASGLSPTEVLVAATSAAADCIGRDDLGALEAGRRADLVVLGGDPTADVANLHSIESVWIAGNRVPDAPR